MTITNEIINSNPDKYETVIQSRILDKQLQMKLNQYTALQRQYDTILQTQNNNRKHGSDSWMDLQNVNYQKGMVSNPIESTGDWIFLGKSNDIDDCKLKAVKDKKTTFSSIVYYPSDFGNDWNKSCFGGIKGKPINSSYQPKTITSIPPNGTTRMGGEEGEKILKEMKILQDEIKKLSKKITNANTGLKKATQLLKGLVSTPDNELENILDRLKNDRIEINKLINEPDHTASEEDSYTRQLSSYSTYGLWVLQVVLLLFIIFYIFSRDTSDISIYIYIFIGIWFIILGKHVYGPVKTYMSDIWKYISYYLVIPWFIV
jgi:hypothetical protein